MIGQLVQNIHLGCIRHTSKAASSKTMFEKKIPHQDLKHCTATTAKKGNFLKMRVNAGNGQFTGGKYSRRLKTNRGRLGRGAAFVLPAL